MDFRSIFGYASIALLTLLCDFNELQLAFLHAIWNPLKGLFRRKKTVCNMGKRCYVVIQMIKEEFALLCQQCGKMTDFCPPIASACKVTIAKPKESPWSRSWWCMSSYSMSPPYINTRRNGQLEYIDNTQCWKQMAKYRSLKQSNHTYRKIETTGKRTRWGLRRVQKYRSTTWLNYCLNDRNTSNLITASTARNSLSLVRCLTSTDPSNCIAPCYKLGRSMMDFRPQLQYNWCREWKADVGARLHRRSMIKSWGSIRQWMS